MAEKQTRTGWWLAYCVFHTVWGSFLTIDYYLYRQRPFRVIVLSQ